jgi:GTP-binding protein
MRPQNELGAASRCRAKSSEIQNMKMRNIAIIAHVDHGKTTLVDELLKQSGSFRDNQRTTERMMDSNDLEKERGITILAKATSIEWKGVRVNIVDTPGHADFGGEVERILSMVDGAIVLVDSSEGPMPQTKFVVGKALKVGLRPIVAINKIDRPDGRHEEVINEVFDLFANLDATDEQLDFPILYGSGRDGWMNVNPEGPKDEGLAPLLDLVLKHVPEPSVGDEDGAFRMIGTLLEANPFLGRIITGRIHSGSIKPNQPVKVLSQDGKTVETGRISKILAFRGIERTPIDEAHAGDIVAIAGLSKGTVADTFCDPSVTEALHAQPIDPPTVTMSFLVNDSAPCRHRRRQGDEPRHPRSPVQGSRRQCRAEDRGSRGQGFVLRVRPWRIAARRPDRNHAPRRFRACRVASARRHAQVRGRHADGADRGSRHRRR